MFWRQRERHRNLRRTGRLVNFIGLLV